MSRPERICPSAAIGLTVLAFYHPFLLAFSIFVVVAVAIIVLVLGRGAVRTGVNESRCKYEVVGWMEELARHPRIFMRGSTSGSGVGSRVRLQFEGWPAVQFVGWPSVAVGTFGGEVISIDAIDDGAGRFRIVIRPDPADAPWPGT